MAHSTVRVVKEAIQQAEKATSWILPLEGELPEGIDEEIVENAVTALKDLVEHLKDWISS